MAHYIELDPEFDSPLEETIASAMAEFGPTEFDVTAFERGFEKWLGSVEALSGCTVDAEDVPLLMSDDALTAYEEGVTAADYALQIQAARAGA